LLLGDEDRALIDEQVDTLLIGAMWLRL